MMEPKDVVLDFINAMNREDFDAARKLTHEDLQFVGVLGSRNGAEAYFKDMKKMKLKYYIQKVFHDKNDVCLWYDIDMSGTVALTCGWYKVKQGKIAGFTVLFDPRPVLEASEK